MRNKTQLAALAAVLIIVAAVVLLREKRPHPHVQQHTTCLAMGMRAGWALDEHRKAHPGYPRTLADLVPAEISSVPSCPASKEPLHYQSDGDSYVLYCPGALASVEAGAMKTYPVHRPVGNKNQVENFSGPPPELNP